MAARLLCSGERTVVFYAHGFRSLCAGKRSFSSQGRNDSKETAVPPDVKKVTGEKSSTQTEPPSTWLDIRAGIFGPSDERLPLPGNVGPGHQLLESNNSNLHPNIITLESINNATKLTPDIFTWRTNKEQAFQAFLKESSKPSTQEMASNPAEILECKIQECPDLVKKDFCDLFPDRNVRESPMAVVTLSQKTEHDMSAWSEEMEEERDELLELFVEYAQDICNTLELEGYWADFIDPSSGRPFNGHYTNATLFETDERYRHFGLHIEDLGCCKVISHRKWGTHVFVGAIFTNAPVESEVLEMALKKHQIGQDSQ